MTKTPAQIFPYLKKFTKAINLYKKIAPHLFFFFFAVFYLVFCYSTYKDYGITADEERSYNNGKYLISYFKNPTTIENTSKEIENPRKSPLTDEHSRIYPAFISLFNFKGYYEWYHLLNMLFGLLIFAGFYYLIYSEHKNIFFSLFGAFSLFFTPRFLGHIPANPKDFPFAVFYFLTILAMYIFSKSKKSKGNITPAKEILKFIILGFLFGITQSIRTIGFSLYLIYLAYSLLKRKPATSAFLDIILIFITAGFFSSAFWPYIGANFFANLTALFNQASSFDLWDKSILFFGIFLEKQQRPDLYLPVWILITTPLYLLIGFVLSIKLVLKNRLALLLWISIIVNFGLYFLLKPVIYNGLRHFLYLLPIIVFLACLWLFDFLLNKKTGNIIKIITGVLIFLNFAAVGVSMKKLHPYEYIYFNEVIGGLKGAHSRFETDYWGASYKEAADWLMKKEPSKVYPCNLSYAMLYYSKGKFTVAGSSDEADYIVCDYENDLREGYDQEILYQVKRFNVPINIIRKTEGKTN